MGNEYEGRDVRTPNIMAHSGSGGPWEWQPLGMSAPGIGDPWEWLGVAAPGNGGSWEWRPVTADTVSNAEGFAYCCRVAGEEGE